MLYYLTKRDCYDYFTANSAIKNELFTAKERHKKVPYISDENFYRVQINKNHTYFSFGCRFPKSDAIVHFNSDGKNLIFVGSGPNGKFYETILM